MSDPTAEAMGELVEDYVLGMLDGADLVAFEGRLAHDGTLAEQVRRTRDALAAFALSTPVLPDPALKQRVMARIAERQVERPVIDLASRRPVARRSMAVWWLGTALAAAILLAMKLAFDLRRAERVGDTAVAANAHLRSSLAQRDSLLSRLLDPGVELVSLASTGRTAPQLKAYINRARRVMVLAASGLEPIAADQAYQLWFIVGGNPVPSITFHPDSTGRVTVTDVPMPDGAVAATAVTREPAAGSTVPTMPILFLGKLATE